MRMGIALDGDIVGNLLHASRVRARLRHRW